MSDRTIQWVLMLASILLLYLGQAVLSGIPGLICSLAAIVCALIGLFMMIRSFRK